MSSPEPSNLSKEAIHKLAANIASQLGYEPNGDIVSAIQKAGGTIEYREPFALENSDSGSMVIESARKFKIFLSNYTSASRDRFTVAHELGHYVLHYLLRVKNGEDNLGKMVCTRAGEGRIEWEANWFAAGFLMPEELFRIVFSEEERSIPLIAERFGVSQSAALVRAQVLGLL